MDGIATRHYLVLDSLGLILGNQLGTCDTTLGTSLVEEVLRCSPLVACQFKPRKSIVEVMPR